MHATTRAGVSLRAKGDQGRSREIVLTTPTRSVTHEHGMLHLDETDESRLENHV